MPTAPQRRRAVVAPRPAPSRAVTPTAIPRPEGPAETKAAPVFSITGIKRVGVRLINLMVYGPYGHGKTTYAGTALDVPEMNDVLFVAAEPGDMSLTSRRGLDIIYINKYTQIARIFEYLVRHCMWRDEPGGPNVEKLLKYERELKSNIVPLEEQTPPTDPNRTWFEEQRIRTGRGMDEPFLYRTVILDNISEIHKYLVYKFTGVNIGSTKLDEEIERMEEWQVAQEMFRLFVRSFRDLPMNVIFIAAEAIEPEMRNKKKNPLAGQSLPKLAGQAAADIAGFVDIVGYLIREVGKDGDYVRRLYLGAGYEGFISKHRFENLPDLDYIENPTLASLLDLARKDDELRASGHSQEQARPVAPSVSARQSSRSTRPVSSQRSSAARASAQSRSGGARRGDHAVRRQRS